MRSMVEGPLPIPKNPSTALRAVPLPRKTGGGFYVLNPPSSITLRGFETRIR